MSKVVVTGASGFVGTQVVERLAARGHVVIGVTRDVQRARSAGSAGVSRWVELGTVGMADAIRDAGRVVNLAGVHPFSRRWSKSMKRAIYDTRVETTKVVAKALRASEVSDKVIVNAGGTPIWGDRGDEIIYDDTPTVQDGFLPRMIQDWETAARSSGARFCGMRIGLAFGAVGFGPFQILARHFRRFQGGHPGSGQQFLPWIHVDDCARMFVAALEDPRWEGPFVCGGPNPARARDLAQALGRALGRPSWLHPPAFVVRALVGGSACLFLEGQRAIPERRWRSGSPSSTPRSTAPWRPSQPTRAP